MLSSVKKGVVKLVLPESQRDKWTHHYWAPSLFTSQSWYVKNQRCSYLCCLDYCFPWCLQVKICLPFHIEFFPSFAYQVAIYSILPNMFPTPSVLFLIPLCLVCDMPLSTSWSKTEGPKGATIILMNLNNPTFPIPTLHHQLSANVQVLPGAPLFIFKTTDGSWEPITKSSWLVRCNEVWIAARLPPLKAHALELVDVLSCFFMGPIPILFVFKATGNWGPFWSIGAKFKKFFPFSFLSAHLTLVDSSMASFKSRFYL